MVRNDRRTRLLPKILIGQFFVTLLVVIMSLGVIYYAQGYRIDFGNFRILKTGVLYLEFDPSGVTVKLNNMTKKENSAFVENLTPGFYDIYVEKPQYSTWHIKLQVRSESVNDFSKIVLFKSDIKISDLTDSNKINQLHSPTDALATSAPDQLLFNTHEIWVGNRLVTRLADPIQNAIWYPDLAHVIYQQGKSLRVIELNGQNDTLLATLSSDKTTIMTVGSRGSELYYQDGDTYKVATIR